MRLLILFLVLSMAGAAWLAAGSDATPDRTVAVTLEDWSVTVDRASVPAGPVRFETRNAAGREHELQVIRTDLAPGDLPVGLEGVHYERAGELVLGRAHGHDDHGDRGLVSGHIRPGGSRRDVVRLEPGRYVLLCNLPGHYAAGQRTPLTVR